MKKRQFTILSIIIGCMLLTLITLQCYVYFSAQRNYSRQKRMMMTILERHRADIPRDEFEREMQLFDPMHTPPENFRQSQMLYDRSLGHRPHPHPPKPHLFPQLIAIQIGALGTLLTAIIMLYILIFRQKSLEEMKRDFTHNITHELKTPIAVAVAAADTLLKYDKMASDPAKRTEYLTMIGDQLTRLTGMVDRILHASIEDYRLETLRFEECPVAQIAQEVVNDIRLKSTKEIVVETDIPQDLTLNCDRFHLTAILSNLVDNAVKYSGDRVLITLRAHRTGQGVEIEVADNGIGIPHRLQEAIFQKFYRVPTGDLHNAKGYGLGLYYAKNMMEQLGGKIEVESIPTQGSLFRLKFSNHA